MIAIDIGNTNITVGMFRGKRLVKKTKIPTAEYGLYARRLKAFLGRPAPEAVISSVAPKALYKLEKALRKSITGKIVILGRNAAVPIKNLYKVKKQVGQDRLVNAFGAAKFYGSPCVIMDLGTAITFDVVSREGAYLGGLILPGIEMSFAGLYEKTELLPKVALAPARHIIGKDTVESMRGGILFGFGAMCDGLVAKYRKLLGKDLKVIATGGNARLIKKYAKSIQIVDEDLTLKGLHLISTRLR